MKLRDVKKGITILSGIAVLGFSITGCGGGGGSSSVVDSTAVESQNVVIDESNSEQIISTVFNAVEVGVDPTLPLSKSTGAVSTSIVKTIDSSTVFKQVLSTTQDLNIASGESMECTDGGSITYGSTEIAFNNCNESGMIMDGTATVSGTATEGTMTLTNFSITFDSESIFYESLTYSFVLNSASEISSMSITMDGYTSIFGQRTDYQNYTLSMNMDSSDTLSLSVSGLVKTDCLGGWIEIRTTQNIQTNIFESCPTSGQIVIGGNASSITIDFNADGSVNVSGVVTDHYVSCEDIDAGICTN